MCMSVCLQLYWITRSICNIRTSINWFSKQIELRLQNDQVACLLQICQAVKFLKKIRNTETSATVKSQQNVGAMKIKAYSMGASWSDRFAQESTVLWYLVELEWCEVVQARIKGEERRLPRHRCQLRQETSMKERMATKINKMKPSRSSCLMSSWQLSARNMRQEGLLQDHAISPLRVQFQIPQQNDGKGRLGYALCRCREREREITIQNKTSLSIWAPQQRRTIPLKKSLQGTAKYRSLLSTSRNSTKVGAFSARGAEICCLHIQLNGLFTKQISGKSLSTCFWMQGNHGKPPSKNPNAKCFGKT